MMSIIFCRSRQLIQHYIGPLNWQTGISAKRIQDGAYQMYKLYKILKNCLPPLTCQFLYCYHRRTKSIEAMWSNTLVSCSRDVCVSSMTLDTKNKWQWMIILENRAGTTFVLWLFCLTFQKKAQIRHLTIPIHTLCSSWDVALWSNTL